MIPTTIKVLIARTVSLAEVDNVLADVARIISYSRSPHSAAKCLRESLSQCNDLRKTIRPPNNIDPYTNGSDTFPNHILCDEHIIQGNNYLSVNVGFLLFGLNRNVTLVGNVLDMSWTCPFVLVFGFNCYSSRTLSDLTLVSPMSS